MRTSSNFSLAILPSLLMLVSACTPAPPRIEVGDAWARESNSGMSAAYLTIHNGGGSDDLLTGVRSPAASATLHVTQNSGGIARMRPVSATEGMAVPAGGELRLRPGGAHVMLTGLKQPAAAGTSIPITLIFANSPPRPVHLAVRAAGETSHGH